ncbi:MAG: ribulose-phosphate 3-epimerase [Candidatus Peregrinibacteria bacterium]
MPKLKITPSILGVDYGRMNEHLKELESFSDWFHVDVMDGNFVNNLTVGAPVVARIKTKVPLDCHLMINNPGKYLEDFAKAGAYSITIQAEASGKHLSNDIDKIHALGCRAAVALNPNTPIDKISHVLQKLDMVLVMSVFPGFGGQEFITDVLTKVRWLREHFPDLDIQVDGGINDKTAPLAIKAGANVLVAGSYILKNKNPKAAAERLRG